MKNIVKHYAGNIPPVAGIVLLAMSAGFGLAGCESTAYYWQASSGHLGLMNRRQSVGDILDSDSLEQTERAQLEQAVAIRDYAAAELALPVGGSYRHLVRLESNYVTWNVFAAGPLSMEPVQWCFPVAGCVSYRGYFKQGAAEEFAAKMQQKGLDVIVGGATAYSTLGWFKDPLLSTFLRYDDTRLASLLFHELAHQVVYVKGDTSFNESFASAVEELAVEQWLRDSGRAEDLQQWSRHSAWVDTFARWLLMHREALQLIYQSNLADAQKRDQKQDYFASIVSSYAGFRDSHAGDHSYDAWMRRPLNNASLLSIGSYNDWVGAFKQLFSENGCRWPDFYTAAQRLGERDSGERIASLEKLQRGREVALCVSQPARGESANET